MNMLNSTSNGLINSPSKWNGLNLISIFLDILRIGQKLTCSTKNFDTAVTRNALICSRNTFVNERGGELCISKSVAVVMVMLVTFLCLITTARQ